MTSGRVYRVVGISGRKYFAHRLAWLIHFGKWPKEHIDHINGDGSDNRLLNLREANTEVNAKNQKLNSRNRSGRVGVYQVAGTDKYVAQIFSKGVYRYLGAFGSFEAASQARAKAELELGFHQNHGKAHGAAP